MEMRAVLFIATLLVLGAPQSVLAFADEQSMAIDVDTEDMSGATRTWIFTGTIGSNWTDFPFEQKITMSGPGELEASPLDYTGDIYLTAEYKSDDAQSPIEVYPVPQLLRTEGWFSGTNFGTNAIFLSGVGKHCCYYNPCPIIPGFPTPGPNGSCDVFACCPPGGVGPCLSRRIFEQPVFNGGPAVTTQGQIHLVDAHGGSASDTWFLVKNTTTYQSILTTFIIYFRFIRPGEYFEGRMIPGLVRTVHDGISGVYLPTSVLCVHLSSSDFPGTSPGVVDAADLAVFASKLGQPRCYGVASDPLTCTQQTWYCDLNQDGQVDASDLGSFVSDLGDPEEGSCHITKADLANEVARILDWFGIAATGRMISEGSREIPEYEVVDSSRLQRAIADPYGYRVQVESSERKAWGSIKTLYR